jgi:hypothetical protein
MKTISKTLTVALFALLAALMNPAPVFSADSNFQISPPPIAYPYFEAGRTDAKIEPMFLNIEAQNISLSGGGVNFDARQAFSEEMAVDVQGNLLVLSGEMPGIPPLTLIPAYSGSTFLGYYTPQTTGKAKVGMMSIGMSLNVEFQPFHSDAGGLIIFGGPNINITRMTMQTPYRLYYPPSTYYSGYTDTLTIASVTGGVQFGLQGDIALGSDARISPFVMTSTSSGSSTLTDDPGVSGVADSSTTGDIPSSTTSSLGMDIIIGNFSVGTVMQQMKAQSSTSDDVKITMFRMGYRY